MKPFRLETLFFTGRNREVREQGEWHMQSFEKTLFELLPFQTKETKARIGKIIRENTVDPLAAGEGGNTLLQEAVFYERFDVIEQLAVKEHRLYGGGSGAEAEWYEAFRESVKSGSRGVIGVMICRGILKCVPDDEKTMLYSDLASFKDMNYIDQIVKEEHELDSRIVPEIRNYMDRKFVQALLGKYKRKLTMRDEKESARMVRTAVLCDDRRLAKTILKKQAEPSGLGYLAEGSDDMFHLLLKMSGKVRPEERAEILTYVYMGPDGDDRLEQLMKKTSWRLTFRNEEGKDVCDIMENKIESIRYPNNKSGYLARQTYHKKLQKLQKRVETARAL